MLISSSHHQFALVNAPTLSLNFNVEDDNFNVRRPTASAARKFKPRFALYLFCLSQVIAAVDRDFASFGEVIASMFADKNAYVVHLSTQNNHLYSGRLRCVERSRAHRNDALARV